MNETDLRAMWDAMTPDERDALSARVSGAVDGLRGQVLAIVDRANADYAAGRFDPREVAWINAEDHIGDAPKMVPPPAEAVERLADQFDDKAGGWPGFAEDAADMLRALAAERDALRAEVTKLEGERIDLISDMERAQAALSELATAREQAEAALTEARAATGALIEKAESGVRRLDTGWYDGVSGDFHRHSPEQMRMYAVQAIRALTPADATAAQAARDKATREGCAALVGRWRDMIREMELFEHFLDRLPDIIRNEYLHEEKPEWRGGFRT
ncbi:hypothetical protein EBL87_09085 [Cereibacter sphaeroides]|uniref:hypothetical protein n=1 Tax=Cereibacter sphaeroides TaxID=1063 RepID=UPI000F53A569|nr:hypothetical protein [Cereibacter sphaeroides]AZB63882.1 hypothetical protein EBL87_09085 [Cereibacter sphaeroides]AZB68196.1 hypothetical protein EBL86_07385 [Cereibacter sphaeroides]